MKRQTVTSIKKYKKKKALKKKLLLLSFSCLALMLTIACYFIFYDNNAKNKLLNRNISNKSLSFPVADNPSNYDRYAKGTYKEVYDYVNGLKSISNRNLKMDFGKDGYFQMTNTNDNIDIKILQLTDLHIKGALDSSEYDLKALKATYSLISETSPDFIVLTGDVIFGSDNYDAFDGMRALNILCLTMDKAGIPWTLVMGNHDHAFFDNFDNPTITSMLSQSRTLKMYEFDSSISGISNGVFKINNSSGKLSFAFFVLDSGNIIKSNDETDGGYDYIKDDQTEWYKKEVRKLNVTYGKTIPSIMFFHIPIWEYDTAYSEGQLLFGNRGENVYCSKHHSSIFDAAVDLRSTSAMFCGHDHLNNYCSLYKGIKLCYSRSIDYITYPGISSMSDQRGATLINISSEGNYTIDSIQYDS